MSTSIRTSAAPFTPVALDPGSPAPLYRQLYDEVRAAILSGRLAPGTRIPSTRALAEELDLSRNTVALAFGQLHAEGYIEGQARTGTFVTRTLPDVLLRVRAPVPPRASRPRLHTVSARGAVLAGTGICPSEPVRGLVRPFRAGAPALELFPRRTWLRLAARRWRTAEAPLAYDDPAGYQPLREAIAAHVSAARGAQCTADQVIVVNGSQQGLDLAARVLLDPGDAVWLEDPGYVGARAALLGAGARVVAVPLDGEGLSVADGERLAPDARMACVTPSHQYPTGVTMSAGRRIALLRWATRADGWIVEDDYDSEFRYASRPLACLQGMDVDGRVVYIGTFSKTLFPALRLGYLVVPSHVADAFRAARAVLDRHSPTVDQAVLADFIAEGHFARHVRRMRQVYEERQGVLLDTGRALLGGLMELEPADAGMHLVGWLPRGMDDGAMQDALGAEGIDTIALSRHAMRPCDRGALLLGYAAFDRRTIRRGVERMAVVLERAARGRRTSSSPTG
ncbi:MAG TPA: PLP-dependent aminotransferase family protein [Gemmatimonadales bacterium]|nr:PLP-dependent aminotransferase family protein [Gemmatimonadales bacterium]